jgi:hypothetical protein
MSLGDGNDPNRLRTSGALRRLSDAFLHAREAGPQLLLVHSLQEL